MEQKVYFITESDDYDSHQFGFAFSDENIEPKHIQNWNLDNEWKPLLLYLQDGIFADYLINDLNIPLCSKALKEIINMHADNAVEIIWFLVKIISPTDVKEYYYLKLQKILSGVIDMEKSEVQNNTILTPFFIKDDIQDIFRVDYDENYLFVSSKLKERIVESGMTGLSFYTW